jgi:hypothetical protein
VLLWFRSLPVNEEDVKGSLIEVDLEENRDKFGASHPSEKPIILFKVCPVGFVGGHEKENSLLQFVEHEPVADHEEEVPKVKRAEKVQHVDYERDHACAEAITLVGAHQWI